MKVSVIIPFYSNIEWLEEAIESVLSQTFKDYEIIVINDGSPEDDLIFIEKYKDKINYYKTSNKGPAHARNYGINIAKGEYLAFLDSDDIWIKEKLERQISFMNANNSDWSHTNYLTFSNKTKEILAYNELEIFSGYIFPASLASTHIATPSVVIRKEVLLNNRLYFQEKMRYGQDYYLWLKLSKSYKLDLVPEFLLKVRVRGSNAAIRTRAHIQVRGQIWDLLNEDDMFSKGKNIKMFRLCYRFCSIQNRWLTKLEKSYNPNMIEKLSKILYIMPYLMFKILFKLSNSR